jgi:regulator of cell morphogenesis and NO signaling
MLAPNEALRVNDPPAAPVALIAFILDNFHLVHRTEFPVLQGLARRVEDVHAGHAQCPEGLADFLFEMEADLEQHMCKEEQVLFPLLANGGGGCTPMAIARMLAEHDDHVRTLARLARLTRNFEPPADACRSWRALYAGCAKLDRDLREHIRIENELLFAQFA